MSERMKTDGDEPTNPIIMGDNLHRIGLTKREYFAAMAMQGMISCNTVAYFTTKEGVEGNDEETFAVCAVEYADALITALSQPTGVQHE